MDGNNKMVAALSLFLLLQFIMIFNTRAKEIDYVNINITIRNEMKGMKRPEIVYRCQSKRKDYGWRRSAVPGVQHSFPIVVEVNESVIPAIHLCHFRSVLGTADLVIKNTYLDAEVCRRCSCAHEATPDGIKFRGHEWDFKYVFPKLKRVVYTELPWRPWPRRHAQSNTGQGGHGDKAAN